jgi:hypothetical protein
MNNQLLGKENESVVKNQLTNYVELSTAREAKSCAATR